MSVLNCMERRHLNMFQMKMIFSPTNLGMITVIPFRCLRYQISIMSFSFPSFLKRCKIAVNYFLLCCYVLIFFFACIIFHEKLITILLVHKIVFCKMIWFSIRVLKNSSVHKWVLTVWFSIGEFS